MLMLTLKRVRNIKQSLRTSCQYTRNKQKLDKNKDPLIQPHTDNHRTHLKSTCVLSRVTLCKLQMFSNMHVEARLNQQA